MKFKVSYIGFLLIVILTFFACDLSNDDNNSTVFRPHEFELKMFELTNVERGKEGLPALIWNDTLAAAAREHSKDLMQNNITGHVGSNGSTLRQRIEGAGILNWSYLAENCSYGRATPELTIAGLMNSPGHRANILNPEVTHLGVGYVPRPEGSSAQYSTYWTQKFCAFK